MKWCLGIAALLVASFAISVFGFWLLDRLRVPPGEYAGETLAALLSWVS